MTVGNAVQPFTSLLDALEEVSGGGDIEGEDVVVQLGNTPRRDNCRWRQLRVFPHDEFQRMIEEASAILCHGGAGTLLEILSAGKKPIVMPRRSDRGEHVDDHQRELVEALAREGRVVQIESAADLRRVLWGRPNRTEAHVERVSEVGTLLRTVSDILSELEVDDG